MPKTILRGSVGTTWLWIALFALMFFLVVGWFVDPLGYVKEAKPAQTAISSEWTVAPNGPVVPVNLPQVRLRLVEKHLDDTGKTPNAN